MKKKRTILWRGMGVIFAFLCAFLFGAYNIASFAYKSQVDDFLGAGSGSGSADAGAYAFRSDYKNTTEMLTERRRTAIQLAEEGCVLLKNRNDALPLRKNATDDREMKITLLGSRAYTYDSTGKLRDTGSGDGLSAYAGVIGSHQKEQRVTTNDGVFDLPITLEMALQSENISIDPKTKKAYDTKPFPNFAGGSEANGSEGTMFNAGEAKITKEECGTGYSDAAIVVIGRSSGEGREYIPGVKGVAATHAKTGDKGQLCALGLSDNERNLISVAKELSDRVVVLVNSAVAMDINELKEGELSEKVDAVLWIGLPGLYGMTGVARILSGNAIDEGKLSSGTYRRVSPSGHLSDLFAVNSSMSPAAQNFSTQDQAGQAFAYNNWSSFGNINRKQYTEHFTVLAEGIYTGYRYYETRYADYVYGRNEADSSVGSAVSGESWKYQNEVAYTFGYGKSYASFTEEIVEGSLQIDLTGKTYSLRVRVSNTGDITAKHVVQLYVQAPYTDYDASPAHSVEKSAVQLLDFEKVELGAGAETEVELKGELKYVASYDKKAQHDGVEGGYTLEAGDYYFAIGNGAHEALNNVIALEGNGNADRIYHEEGSQVNAKGAVKWNSVEGGLQVNADGVNATLFATTSEGGAIVRNQMKDADYNYYKPNTITYLSRSRWATTFPRAYTNLELVSSMADPLNGNVYTVNSNSANMPVFGYDHSDDEDEEGNPYENMVVAEMKLKSFDDENWEYLLDQVSLHEAWQLAPYGGTSNAPITSVASPEAWQIDGPSGNISRGIASKSVKGLYYVPKSDPNAEYKTSDMPCEPLIAATFHKELLEKQGKLFGEDFIWSGNAMIWAPGMNLHRLPFNARNHEYYSEDPMLTNLCGAAMVKGGLEKGALLAAKHFAFNCQESNRQGLAQYMEEQSARELELRGYEGAVEDVNYDNSPDHSGNKVNLLGVMTSFSRIGVHSVNAHTGLMKNILRLEWGFKGLSSTDMVIDAPYFIPEDTVINNVTFMATSSGATFLRSVWHEYAEENVKKDAVLCQALRENMHYYLYALANSSALNGIDTSFVIIDSMSWWQVALISVGVGLGVVSAGMFTLYVVGVVQNRKAEKSAEQGRNGNEKE